MRGHKLIVAVAIGIVAVALASTAVGAASSAPDSATTIAPATGGKGTPFIAGTSFDLASVGY